MAIQYLSTLYSPVFFLLFFLITRLFLLKIQNMEFQTTFEHKFSQLSSVSYILSFVLLKGSWLKVLWATEAKIKAAELALLVLHLTHWDREIYAFWGHVCQAASHPRLYRFKMSVFSTFYMKQFSAWTSVWDKNLKVFVTMLRPLSEAQHLISVLAHFLQKENDSTFMLSISVRKGSI